ncbi:peptidyl-prolyl cis-trans isomerase [Oecophyllibacter saccharovorans]|uniref:Parvulin-like PPIase n=1 Tax=Oecophyllibacter saccharovorans TaxID=2558360 RepID=A0A506UQF4_9PROT|nr:peptidyl-prolyl cis-trans isomerase [Oecophyllibacter saccharovorans]TPW35560.1 peptidylprolyl isomerase [Oecophyllibacter saccharovorans]
MITALRRFLVDSWFGRALILLCFIAFVGFGAYAGLSGSFSSGADVVVIGHEGITPQQLGRAIDQQVVGLENRGIPTAALAQPGAQQEIGQEVLRNMVIGREAALAARRNGISINDALIRETVFSMPEFRNARGQFDRQKMLTLLQRNGLDENYLISQTKQFLFTEATLLGLGDSAQVPASLTAMVARFLTQHYVVDVIELPFEASTASLPQPTEAQLHRFYDNHPAQFSAPELRHARIVAMTPDTVAASLQVPDKIVHEVYVERARDYNQPELRSVKVMGTSSAAQAQEIAQAWRKHADWKELQKRFPQAIPVSLDGARREDLPDAALAKAVFAAPLGKVTGPVRTDSGWAVLLVSVITPPHLTTEAQAKPGIIAEIQKLQGPALLKSRAKAFQEAVAGSTNLEKIPADLGAVPASGRLDAQGRTEAGMPAPLPGTPTMQSGIVRQIFSQRKGALPHVVTLADGSAFAVLVDDVVPSHPRNFEESQADVRSAWLQAARKRAQNEQATALLQKAKTGSLAAAVTATPLAPQLQKDQVVTHLKSLPKAPQLVASALFRMKPGVPVMLEAGGAFWLLEVTARVPAPATEVEAVQRQLTLRQQRGMQTDLLDSLGQAYAHEVPPEKFNPALFRQTLQNAFQQLGIAVQQPARQAGTP